MKEECPITVHKKKQKHYYILEHKLVPNHEILSDKETTELLEKFDIEPEQLPKILDTDPAAISIEAVPGQILKITRKSRTAKCATAYRFVIESEGR
ncbi:MAG: DNA-directed RNA polymerase subunit H [Thermoplasmatales archaeon]|nr:DNA-directed RNA polymerase subunit H [Thermoplasmatales archaeon]